MTDYSTLMSSNNGPRTLRAATFNFADLADYCWPVETQAEFFNPAANNLYLEAFPPTRFDCTPPLNLAGHPRADLFRTFPLIHEYAETHGAGPGFVATLSNARLATPYAFLFDRHGVLFNDSYHNARMVRLPMERMDRLIRVDLAMNYRGEEVSVPTNTVRFDWPPRKIDEPCLLLASPWCEGYHHWILEALPRLWAADAYPELAALPVVVPDWLQPFHLESLAALGYGEDRLRRFDGTTWDFAQLYVPSFIAPGGHSPRQVTWLKNRLALALGVQAFGPEGRLYVSRRDAKLRRLANEDEIADMLERDYGFRTIVPGELSLAEQVAAFAQAEIVLGVDGSGLTNHVFAPAGATVIALHPADYVNRAHWYLACAAGQHYAFEVGDTVNESQDFEVPAASLAATMEKVLA